MSEANHSNLPVPSLRMSGAIDSRPHTHLLDMHKENLQGADKSLARPTSGCVLFNGENISFDASLVIYIYTHTHTYILIFLQL
jgi:hypothetical protein